MLLRNKFFFSIAGLAISTGAIVSVYAFNHLRETLVDEHKREYLGKLQLFADTFQQIEKSVDAIGASSAQAFVEIDRRRGLVSERELPELVRRLNVSHIFITDRTGKFIRSTNGDPATFHNTLFDYCEDYKTLITGNSEIFKTPIIPSSDELTAGPFKYFMVPNFNRSRVLEISIHLDFIKELLQHTISADENILSVGFFTPTGQSLGNLERPDENETSNAFTSIFEKRITTETKSCCECRNKGIAAGPNSDEYYYVAKATVSENALIRGIKVLRNRIILLFVIIVALSALFAYWLTRRLLSNLETVRSTMNSIHQTQNLSGRIHLSGDDEVCQVAKTFDAMVEQLEISRTSSIATEKTIALAELSQQLAHDIRSPLSALNVALSENGVYSAERRSLAKQAVARISEIANNLLRPNDHNASEASPTLIYPILSDLILEKELQHGSRANLIFRLECDQISAFTPAELNNGEFKRVVSNLLNNAVESIEDDGEIRISFAVQEKYLELIVCDTGCGIASDVIPSLGIRGATFGKKGGSGLGLYHAREMLSKIGGDLLIESTLRVGTTVKLKLPVSNFTAPFVRSIDLSSIEAVVIVDDDPTIAGLWRPRLGKKKTVTLTSPNNVRENFSSLQNYFFLVDLYYQDVVEDGIQLITSLGIQDRAVLVSSANQEPSLLKRLRKESISFLPKSLIEKIELNL